MAQFQSKNLTGKIFGHVRVLRSTKVRIDGCVVWKCSCSVCGKFRFMTTKALTKPGRRSCGCARTGKTRQGTRAGRERLIANWARRRYLDSCDSYSVWLLDLDVEVSAIELRTGFKKSVEWWGWASFVGAAKKDKPAETSDFDIDSGYLFEEANSAEKEEGEEDED